MIPIYWGLAYNLDTKRARENYLICRLVKQLSMACQAELVKIGLEGFAIIDKYYGRPRRSGTGRPYYPPPGYQYSSQFSQMKEPINNSNMPNSNTAGHANYRGIHSELR